MRGGTAALSPKWDVLNQTSPHQSSGIYVQKKYRKNRRARSGGLTPKTHRLDMTELIHRCAQRDCDNMQGSTQIQTRQNPSPEIKWTPIPTPNQEAICS